MLHNEGSLFIIEEVRKRYALMTSVEFEFAEAAVKYEDGRKISLWENIVLGQLTVDYIPGEHISCLKEPYVREVAKLIK